MGHVIASVERAVYVEVHYVASIRVVSGESVELSVYNGKSTVITEAAGTDHGKRSTDNASIYEHGAAGVLGSNVSPGIGEVPGKAGDSSEYEPGRDTVSTSV